ncbi:MAG: DNA internalization-related competence protein ComEC/Rec2 [Ignavibacteria bacterium]|nr:DNA internalization-related competence protein ComEC/Rec2 [Ignavibacteria bacterium]
MKKLDTVPAVKFCILFIVGVIIGNYFCIPYYYSGPVILLSSIFSLISKKYNKKVLSFVFSFLLIMSAGCLKIDFDKNILPENSIKNFYPAENEEIILAGVVDEIPRYDSSRIKFVLNSEVIETKKNIIDVKGMVMVTVKESSDGKKKIPPPALKPGDRVRLSGFLRDFPDERNPGEFNYRKYLEIHNIYKSFYVFGYNDVQILSSENLGFIYQRIVYPFKEFASSSIDSLIGIGDEAGYLKGLVTGERSDISKEVKDDFIKAGVMHIIAVSGLNVAYIILFATLLLSLFRIPQRERTIITIIIIIFYCLFTGAPASIVRASIMGILFLVSFLIQKKTNFYNITAFSAILILLFDSKQLFDPGFILSYTAVLSMVFFYNRFEELYLKKIQKELSGAGKFLFYIISLAVATFAAQIGTIPVTATYFEKISIISFLSNIIAVPVANISLAMGFLQVLLATISGFFASLIAETNLLLLTLQLVFINWCASLSFSYVYFSGFSIAGIVIYYFVILFILYANKKNILFRLLICILIVLLFVVYSNLQTQNLKVIFFDVGQGDCSLISTPSGENILVDCGVVSGNYNSAERVVLPYLKRNHIEKIDLLLISHYHSDHIGGLKYLLENIRIDKIIDNGQSSYNLLSKSIDSLIAVKNIPKVSCFSGDTLNLSDSKIYFIYPLKEYVISGEYKTSDIHDGCLVFKYVCGNTDILYPGDIEEVTENFLVKYYGGFLKTDILKISNHGGEASSSIPFLVKTNPQYSVISCGLYNRYDNPSDLIIGRLTKINTQIFRTDLDGAVIFELKDEEIEPVKWK